MTQGKTQILTKPAVKVSDTKPDILPMGLTYVLETPPDIDFGVQLRFMLAE